MADAVRTTCPYCGVGCGVLAETDGTTTRVSGDPTHPANFGRLCVKGSALAETTGLEGRLLRPRVGTEEVSWDRALSRVANELTRIIADHGPDAVAFYVSGQLLTEDYYVANKLMKGFIGGANIDTNSRLCMSSSVAGHVRAFGSDTVPGCYEDLEEADLVVLVGSNSAWCHPVLFQRIQAAKAARPTMRTIVIDPRRTATADDADLHLPLRPGSDAALFNGLLLHLVQTGQIDQAFVQNHTDGFVPALAAAAGTDPVALCDVPAEDIATFYRWFAETEKVVTVYSQGVNQSSQGTDKVNAIINCHLLSGRIGRPGMGPLSFTGQPNAMGGREVGGLANQLAAHMGFTADHCDRVARFWDAPNLARKPGHKAVDLFQAIATGTIKAVWIVATNPAVSLPDAGAVRAALADCELVIVSDCIDQTDTTAFADICLPALAWGEKDGTVTNSERRISRQRAFLPAPGEAKPDWWIFCEVAKRMGFSAAFAFDGPAAIFREHAALSAFENHGERDFDLGGLIASDYDALAPVQWPVRDGQASQARLFADGRFYHPDQRARFLPVQPARPSAQISAAWPLVLNTGRMRDQWHTMTRTGKSARLATHSPEPFVAIHPIDAQACGIRDQDFAEISSPRGKIIMRARFDDAQRRGELFTPIHWNDQFAGDAVVSRLIAPVVDPISGQPESKYTPVHIQPLRTEWEAVVVSRTPISAPADVAIWSRMTGAGHAILRLAGPTPMADWRGWTRRYLGEGHWIDYQDRRLGVYRAALMQDHQLDRVILIAPPDALIDFSGITALFERDSLAPADRASLLSGQTGERLERGPIVCACHQVGQSTILRAIADQQLDSVEAIGRTLKAGTNCGSCIPELRRLLQQTPAIAATPVAADLPR